MAEHMKIPPPTVARGGGAKGRQTAGLLLSDQIAATQVRAFGREFERALSEGD